MKNVPTLPAKLAAAALIALFATGAAAQGRPPSPVSTIDVKTEAIPIVNELPGRIAPTRIAEVRSRVSGIVLERVFQQGATVKQGDVLYRIDPAQFQAQLASARATLQRAQAAQLQARQQADRQKQLRQRDFASGQSYDNAVAALAQADADVAIAQANVTTAKLNLDYTEIKAPISGRIGRALITEGALVNALGTDSLATIQQIDPVYADFTQSANEVLTLRRALKDGAVASSDPAEAPVTLVFDDGTRYARPGRLLFQESVVDSTTGQITLRGEFPNPDGDLLPGMYIRVQIEQGIQQNVIAIPQQAVQRSGAGTAQVYVVDEKSTVSLRTITLGRSAGERWVVQDGLRAGEQVVVEGFQKIGPGAPVAATPWQPQDAAAAPAPAQTSAQ